MTEALKGRSVEEARSLFHGFHELVTRGEDGEDLGKLAVFTGVREYPINILKVKALASKLGTNPGSGALRAGARTTALASGRCA